MTFSLDANELTDVTEEEFQMYKGLVMDPGYSDSNNTHEIAQVRFSIPHAPLPVSLDWREFGKFATKGEC